jgi:hypothetical protein
MNALKLSLRVLRDFRSNFTQRPRKVHFPFKYCRARIWVRALSRGVASDRIQVQFPIPYPVK